MQCIQHTLVARALRGGTAALLLVAAAASLPAQAIKAPYGNAIGALVRSGAGDQLIAAAELPPDGGMTSADVVGVAAANLAAGAVTAVSSGTSSLDRLGAQSVATAADVVLLNGVIRASRVIAISMLSEEKNKLVTSADGSTIDGLTVNGNAVAAPAANTRMDLPGIGYVILNEQTTGKGSKGLFTVNMIHVVQVDQASGATTGEIIVGSAATASGS
jgi:hypothetical protein